MNERPTSTTTHTNHRHSHRQLDIDIVGSKIQIQGSLTIVYNQVAIFPIAAQKMDGQQGIINEAPWQSR